MSFHIESDYLGTCYYWKPSSIHKVNSSTVIGLDLDHTFIRPKNGRTFPKDFDDWEFIYEDIKPLLEKQTHGYKIVFMTNQKGIDINKFEYKWRNILEDCNITYSELKLDKYKNFHLQWYLICATNEDFYRKPSGGMWDLISHKLNDDILVNKKNSLYVGDAAGRSQDFKATDLMFALNNGVDFEVPEVFFRDDECKKNQTKLLIQQLKKNKKIFNPVEWLKKINYGDDYIKKNKVNILNIVDNEIRDGDLDILVMIGAQGSGKSTFYNKYLKELGYILMSNDTFKGTPGAFKKQIEKHIIAGDKLVIDNTHPGIDIRHKWLEMAHSNNRRCACIYMEATNEKEYIHHIFKLRNIISTVCIQQKKSGCHKVIPIIALRIFYKKLKIPDGDEGFDAVIKIPLIIDFNFNFDITRNMFEMWID